MATVEGGAVILLTDWPGLKYQIDTRFLNYKFEENDTSYEVFAIDGQYFYSATIYKAGFAPNNQSLYDTYRAEFETYYKFRITDFNATEPFFLTNIDGYSVVLKNGATPTVNDGYGIAVIGIDGSNYRMLKVDTSGRPVMVGAGTPGSQVGGLITIQGDPSGTPVPISGSVTVSSGSITVSGNVTANQGTANSVANGWPVKITDGTNVLGTLSNPVRIDPTGTTTQPVSGTVTANAGSGNFAVVQATAALLNATVTANGNFNNASVSATAASPPASATYIGGSVTTSSPTYTTGQMNALSLTTAGALRIDGSAVTQPISGTVTANAGSGTFTVAGTVTANQGTSPWTTNITQFGSSNVVTGTGAGGAGIPRVTVSNDSNILATQSGTWTTGRTWTLSGTGLTPDSILVNQNTPGTLSNAWPVKVTDGTNTMPTADVASRAQFDKITDGTNTAAVKAASTAAVAADPALVVSISPNTPISTTTLNTADLSSSFSPDPSATIVGVTDLMVDAASNLQIRGQVLTDEGSVRDDFIGSSLTTTLTGTVTFTASSTSITGSGTSFTTEVTTNSYIKKSADSETLYVRVLSVDSDTSLTLESPYGGTTSSTTAVVSDWKTSVTGGSITVSSSEVLLASSTANGNSVQIVHQGDYLPFTLNARARITQRIANQTAIIGFQDTPGSAQQQAVIVFDGTSNTVVKFRTSASSAAADIQETQINLPTGLNTSQTLLYEIDLENDFAALLINGSVVATHSSHLPKPYTNLQIIANISNSAVVTTTTLALDLIFFSDTDIVQIGNTFSGDPLKVSIVSSASRTGLVFGQANTGGSAGTLTSLRATTYTEQTTNAQRSIKSSSASDASAGIGARQIKITYYDQTMAGPFTETVTTNGTTAVATTNTNICFVEKMEVVSVGTNRSNVGTISLFANNLGTGTVIGSIAISNVVTAGTVGDNQTLWAHHYVQTGKTCSVTTISGGTNGNQTGVTFLRSVDPTITTNVELQITESFVTVAAAGSGSIFRVAGIPILVSGPARITLYSVSNGTNTTFYGGFEYSE